jgi:hypothetical protein
MHLQNHSLLLFFKRVLLLCSACCCFSLVSAQVLTEQVTDLGFGFKQIQHKQVNVAGRWKSDVKYHFLYYQKRRLCQCTLHAISDSGRYAIFQEMATKESFIFHVNTEEREVIAKAPQAVLKEVSWNKKETVAQLSYQAKDTATMNDVDSTNTISIKIKKRRKK